MPDIRLENLIPNEQRTPEERRENARKAGIASGEARREKKRISQIYADFLTSKHKITIDDIDKELEGVALLTEVMKKVLSRGDSASVSLLKELREATEGSKLQLTGDEGGLVKFEIVDADTPRD
ncbi:MAG: hypothetical protein BWY95_02118 [Bacteroidetes bacterium ADurb.BinA104]|nr:MAG: hypothetical protein BWY95_02118 [Bacteroidetes bacterium ADurb.BinA104]